MTVSQAERIRRLAVQRGPQGVSQCDFNAPAVDGGKPIPQIARRVHDLHKEGCRFADGGERSGFKVYVLEAFAPRRVEHMRTGWRCLACDGIHQAGYEGLRCARCGGGPLLRARVVGCIVNTTQQEDAA